VCHLCAALPKWDPWDWEGFPDYSHLRVGALQRWPVASHATNTSVAHYSEKGYSDVRKYDFHGFSPHTLRTSQKRRTVYGKNIGHAKVSFE
jgi:hypothetical protein